MTSIRLLLLVLLTLLMGCGNQSGNLGRDDDDSATSDDDDTTAADDDDTTAADDDDTTVGDDDDTVGDDDDTVGDDDDTVGDDDDSTGPPPDEPEGMVGRTYCLDWSSVNVTDPPNLIGILGILGISVTDYPLLLSPTAVDLTNGSIWMLVTGAEQGTCAQDMTIPTVDLTDPTPGIYSPPLFEVGPGDFSSTIDGFDLTIFGLEVSGQFSQNNAQVYDSEVTGLFDVTAYASTACALLSCVPCPTGVGSCLNFEADSAEFNDAGGPAIIVVP